MAKYQRIRDLREDAELSQEQMAREIGLYKTTYARYESGERELPFAVAIKIARYHKVTLDYLAEMIVE